MQEISNKQFFKNYAFFILILLVVFGILFYFVFTAKKAWNKNLAVTVQRVLDETEKGRYTVENAVYVNKPLTVNCAAFELTDSVTNNEDFVVLIRIITYYGPIPAVYIYDKTTETTEFIGYSSLHGRIKTQLMNSKSDRRREYWQNRIPEILNK